MCRIWDIDAVNVPLRDFFNDEGAKYFAFENCCTVVEFDAFFTKRNSSVHRASIRLADACE
jgi:hypothetical protein